MTTTSFKVLYVYSFPSSPQHKGLLKVGDATLKSPGGIEALVRQSTHEEGTHFYTSPAVERAAHTRIRQQVSTTGLEYRLEWAILAVSPDFYEMRQNLAQDLTGGFQGFRDHEVHRALKALGARQAFQGTSVTAREWYATDLTTVKRACHLLQTGEDTYRSGSLVDFQGRKVSTQKKGTKQQQSSWLGRLLRSEGIREVLLGSPAKPKKKAPKKRRPLR